MTDERSQYPDYAQRLRDWICERLQGKCRIISEGDSCTCALCDFDRMWRAAPAQDTSNAKRARSMAEYKKPCPATAMQEPHDWRYASSAPGWLIGDACARCQRCEAQGIKPQDGNATQGMQQDMRAAPAQPCECRVGECESKPDCLCRMKQEIQEGGHQ